MSTIKNVFLLACALLLVSCAGSKVGKSGFLKDYSHLREDSSIFADLVYVAPDANFASYKGLIIDPVSLRGERAAKLEASERQMLGNLMRSSFVRSLGGVYPIVSEPGPGVMRLRLAISDVEATNPLLNTSTTVVPMARLVSEGQRLVTGTQTFAGSATLEAEFIDTETGRQLAAGVDRRFGKKQISNSASRWGQVRKIIDKWADQMAGELIRVRDAGH
jgi:hypothetical protein